MSKGFSALEVKKEIEGKKASLMSALLNSKASRWLLVQNNSLIVFEVIVDNTTPIPEPKAQNQHLVGNPLSGMASKGFGFLKS